MKTEKMGGVKYNTTDSYNPFLGKRIVKNVTSFLSIHPFIHLPSINPPLSLFSSIQVSQIKSLVVVYVLLNTVVHFISWSCKLVDGRHVNWLWNTPPSPSSSSSFHAIQSLHPTSAAAEKMGGKEKKWKKKAMDRWKRNRENKTGKDGWRKGAGVKKWNRNRGEMVKAKKSAKRRQKKKEKSNGKERRHSKRGEGEETRRQREREMERGKKIICQYFNKIAFPFLVCVHVFICLLI